MALLVLEQGRGNADREATASGIDDMDRPVDDGLSRVNGLAENTPLFADIRLEHVLAALADRLFTADAGNLLRRLVEGGDAPVVIHRKNPVGDRIQDNVIFHSRLYSLFPCSMLMRDRLMHPVGRA